MAIGANGMIDIGQRRIATGWQLAAADAAVAWRRDVGDRADFEIHVAGHVDDVKAHEQRAGVDVMIVKPGSDFPEQSVANRQHAAKRRDDPDADRCSARPMHNMRRFDQFHVPPIRLEPQHIISPIRAARAVVRDYGRILGVTGR